MIKRFHVFLLLIFFSFCGFCQYDSVAMDRFIDKHIARDKESVIFSRVSDSIDKISKSDHKKYILQVYQKAKTVDNKFMVGNAYNALGLWYLGFEMYSDAFNSFNQAID